MLEKRARLTAEEFDHVFKTGKRLNSNTVSLVYSPEGPFQGAVVVGKKVFPTAVSRNRLRRQLYPILRSMCLTTGIFIVLVKPRAATEPVDTIKDELRTVVQKAIDAVH